ncbi:hypothetical protein GCM10023163_24620 [Aestuariibaculum suncheonense]
MPMLVTITLCIAALVFVNFLLLKFSCNKTPKSSKVNKMPVIIRSEISIGQDQVLSPTGS